MLPTVVPQPQCQCAFEDDRQSDVVPSRVGTPSEPTTEAPSVLTDIVEGGGPTFFILNNF
jgi:hypothetical protein